MLSQFCIRRPIFATVLSIIIVLAGLIALRVLPLSQYPDISPPTVRISTTYDGADAQTLARTVAAPIEDQLSGITGLLYYTTNIRSNGDMSISCVFDVGTDANDAMLEINNRVRTAERRLPDVVRNQGVSVRKRSEENLLMVALFSPDGSMAATDLADYANLNIVDELKRLPGIGDVSVFGNAQSAMRIWLDPERWPSWASRSRTSKTPSRPRTRSEARAAWARRPRCPSSSSTTRSRRPVSSSPPRSSPTSSSRLTVPTSSCA